MADSSTRRYALMLAGAMLFTLWYALTPSRETRVWVADNSFKTVEEGESRRKFRLGLALEQGKTYHIEETTRHTATTRSAKSIGKNAYEVLAQTEYLTTVSLDLYVESVESDRIVCLATMRDFMGYDEVGDKSKSTKHVDDDEPEPDSEDEDAREADRMNRNKEMYNKIREDTKGVQFRVVLGPEGTVQEMDTSKLRETIISALHEVGQLPLHLEHAILVGGYDVYPANGASFGPIGRTSVRAPVYRLKGTGCDDKHPAYKANRVKGKIVVVDRGDCTFNKKAMIASKSDAAAIVVVDTTSTEESVMTYMSGEADVPIVAVIVNKEAGLAIETEMKSKADFKTLDNGDMVASDRYLLEILGGVEAVQALEGDSDDDEDEEGEKQPKKKFRSHNYNPIHTDGLHDFVGIGYVVDEVIRTRFSIFPRAQSISIGSSWERTLEMSDGIDPSVRAEVVEKYKLVSITRAEGQLLDSIQKGDLMAEIKVEARERPTPIKPSQQEERLPINPDPNEPDSTTTKVTPQFARPSFRGHEFSTKGFLQVHVPSGLVIYGETQSESTTEKTVVIINKKTNKRKTMKAKVDLVAVTEYSGSIL